MKLIDFDAHFADVLDQWVAKNQHRFKRPEDMEDQVPDVYLAFLETPADWLEGATPGAYFDRYEDGSELCRLLCEYSKSDVPIPEPLLDRLLALGQEEPLLGLLKDASAPAQVRMHMIELLRQLESEAPMVEYIRWQVERREAEELLENALESLKAMGQAAQRPAKVAFLAAGEEGKEALLDVLCEFPAEEDVFQFALRAFTQNKNRRGLFAGYLAKLDDDRALEALFDVAEGEDVDYIDFLEIRSAIERLGGEAPVRDFSGDPTFQAMRRLQ